MLQPGDSQIVARDRALVGLATLLDPSAFTLILRQSFPETSIHSATPYYLRYKPGTSCLAAYHVRAGDLHTLAYARCHHQDLLHKALKGQQLASVPSALGPGVVIRPELNLVIYAFPNDHEIRALRRLFHPDSGQEKLRRLLPNHRELWNGALTPIRYKPERRCVARLIADGMSAAVKIYDAAGFTDARQRTGAFEDRTPLTLPRLLNAADRYSALAWQWIEGQPLLDEIRDGGSAEHACERVGAALASLHQQHPRLSAEYTRGEYCQAVDAAAEALDAIGASGAGRAQRLCAHLCAAGLDHPWQRTAIHGDFSPDQIVLCRDEVIVLDLDRAGFGDPLIDLGACRAKLIAAAVEGQLDADRAERLAAHLLQGYRRVNPSCPVRDWDIFTAGCLLQIAPEPFRQRKEDWPAKVESLIAHAERIGRANTAAHSAGRGTQVGA